VKLFIRKAIIFTLPIALFVVVTEYIVRKIPNDYSYKNEYLFSNSKNIEILVLGNSHSFFGINPAYFSRSTFNAAHVSQSLNYDYFIFNKYKNKLSNLKTLILPVSYFTLFSKLENGIEDWRVKNYSIYYGCQYHYDLKYNFETIGEKPLMVLKKVYKYLKGSNNIKVSELGFCLNYSNVKQSDLMATGVTAAKRHTKSDLDLLATNINLLNKLITESNAQGIRVVLFTPPARKSYISNLNRYQLSVMKSNIAEIIRENSYVEYYDFMNDTRFVDDDFKDADHLNGIGAKKLTQLIDRIILDKTNSAYIETTNKST
jgi:hypothetical protein